MSGTMRIIASVPPERLASSAWGVPWTMAQRGRKGGRTSSTTNAARGLAWTLRYLRVAAKLWPEMSIVPSSRL